MFSLILLAAGSGKRMNLGYNKMLYEIDGIPIIRKCYDTFNNIDLIDDIIIVSSNEDINTYKKIFRDDKVSFVIGGKERYDSVRNGLEHVKNDYVLIHDGARCFINESLINKIIDNTLKYDCATLAVLSKDTIHIEEDNFINTTINRSHAYLAQTPQGFRTDIIKDAHSKLLSNNNINVTDDAMIVNTFTDHKVRIVESEYSNIKITTIEDVE